MTKSPKLSLVRNAAIALAYLVAALLGFHAAFVARQVSPVWPATGLALWAMVRFGPRVWPAIWVGAAIANLTTNVPVIPSCVIATGNTLEACAGAWFPRAIVDVDRTLDRLRHVVALLVGAALLSTTISASIGVLTLCVSGMQPWTRFAPLWLTWWLGDATGAVIVAPLLLTLAHWPRIAQTRAAWVEVLALEAMAIVVSIVVFALWPAEIGGGQHRLEYLVFPLVMWAGFRFAHPGAALLSATVSCIAVWGTLHHAGPFSEPLLSPNESITLLEIYTAVIATSGLVFGAAIADRNRAERLRDIDHLVTAILSQEQDLKPAARRILQAVGDTLAWDVGVLWRVDDEQQTLEYVDCWQRSLRTAEFVADSKARRFTRGVGLPGRVWASAQPHWVYDVLVDSNFPRASTAAPAGLHGGFAFPILADTTVLGVMEFYTREPSRLDRSLLTLMGAAGSQIGQFIERRRAQQERAALLERERTARLEAEGANRSKDQFLATVSHELRTPLTAILGWASMLQAGKFDANRTAQIYDRIFSNAQAQARIVNDLLDMSRIVSGQLRLEWQRADLCDVARLSIETIRPTAIAKGVALNVDIPDADCPVYGDPARLQQVLWNLLSNAIKFTPAGGVVTLAIRAANGTAAMDVSDTGIGISPASLPRLFDRFWQADSTSTRVHGGLGLGLALVRHIVEIHGGEVMASSAGEGSGSTFTVKLPLRLADDRLKPYSEDAVS
jgi:signal transduction histidine kinase/integral membrane sensor domain MASE1